MQIWIDADACPKPIKEIVYRAAERLGIVLTLVANQPLFPPRSPWIKTLQVPQGFDVADKEIVNRLAAGDLVITSDIPLAAEAIARGAHALNPRGELYTTDNIRELLGMRDFMDILRSTGVQTGGPSPLSQGDRQAFAKRLDQFLARHHGSPGRSS